MKEGVQHLQNSIPTRPRVSELSRFDRFYFYIKGNRWYWYFSIFCRCSLALGFFFAGWVKIIDERFASGLSTIHPMGAYLEALHHTGYYYTFIGIAQILAAVLLLIPRTVTLGALLYFPIIVNIFILSYAVRFDGSYMTAPLMLLANIYILVWNYDKLRFILPFSNFSDYGILKRPKRYSNKFPFAFFSGVAFTFIGIIAFFLFAHGIMPRNSLSDCKQQFQNSKNETNGFEFCECIHIHGQSLDECLEAYERSQNN